MPKYADAENSGGYGYKYRYNYEYKYVYERPGGYVHSIDRGAANTYHQAPLGETTAVYDKGLSSGTHGAVGSSTGSGSTGNMPETILGPKVEQAVTPFTRFETEGPNEECYALLADILREARPFPRLIPGVAYGPSEGHSADAIIWLNNIFGQRVPVNVGFADGMIDFRHEILGMKGIKRPDELFMPKYGIVTYQNEKALSSLSAVKSVAIKVGMKIHDNVIKVHRSEEEIRTQLDGMGLLPQDVVASVLYALIAYGRSVPEGIIKRAIDAKVVSINAANYGVVILPTENGIFRIQTNNPALDVKDAALIQDIFAHLKNVSEIFGSSRREKFNRSKEITIGTDDDNFLIVSFQGKSYHVNQGNGQYFLK